MKFVELILISILFASSSQQSLKSNKYKIRLTPINSHLADKYRFSNRHQIKSQLGWTPSKVLKTDKPTLNDCKLRGNLSFLR